MKSREDLLDSKRLMFNLLKDYSDGKLSRHRVFYRARVEAVGTKVGELESVPPSPVGAIKAAVYTNALDASFSKDLINVYYPLIPGTLPLVGEHVFVIFEDSDRFSSGFWVSRLPQYDNIGVNYSNPDNSQNQQSENSANIFEGTTPSSTQPTEQTIELRYRGVSSNTRLQEQTIRNFEGQDSTIFQGKKVVAIGDSQIASNSPNLDNLRDFLNQRSASSFRSFGRQSWNTRHWRTGEFDGSNNAPRRGEKFDDLIRRESPQILLLFLGGNDAPRGRSAVPDIRWIFETAKSTTPKVYWIAPPVGFDPSTGNRISSRDQISDIILETIGRENFIDSRIVTSSNPPNSRDRFGVHLTRGSGNQISKDWMNYIISQVESRNANSR